MSEYPIHTQEQPTEHNARGSLYSFLIVGLLAVGSVWTILANDPATQARAAEQEAEKARVKEAQMKESISPGGVYPAMSPDQLSEFVEEVQNLIENDWEIKEMTTDGIVTIEEDNTILTCGVLDPTPGDIVDNAFLQYPDVQHLSVKMGVLVPNETILIWDRNIGMAPVGEGGADMVDTDSFVWACPLIAVAAQ